MQHCRNNNTAAKNKKSLKKSKPSLIGELWNSDIVSLWRAVLHAALNLFASKSIFLLPPDSGPNFIFLDSSSC